MHDFANLAQSVMLGVREALPTISDPAIQDRLTLALQALDRGATLTRRLLSLGRDAAPSPQVVTIDTLLAGLRDLLSWSAGSMIEVRTTVDEGTWPVRIDIGQFEMCLLNLVINARDAMQGGGRIVVGACNASSQDATGSGVADAEHVVVSVQDTGTGMPDAVRNRAFDAFFSTKGEGRGSGLGLWMVRNFVASAGGDVRIESEPGQGTRISLWLRRADPIVATIDTTADAAIDNAVGRILLVDDDPMIRRALNRLLIEAGHDVVAIESANDALAHLNDSSRFDLLIADQAMPGLSGTELLQHAARTCPDLSCMLITGYTTLPDDIPSRVEVLRKPIEADALLANVARLIATTTEAHV